jgi:hypothetical protein
MLRQAADQPRILRASTAVKGYGTVATGDTPALQTFRFEIFFFGATT